MDTIWQLHTREYGSALYVGMAHVVLLSLYIYKNKCMMRLLNLVVYNLCISVCECLKLDWRACLYGNCN